MFRGAVIFLGCIILNNICDLSGEIKDSDQFKDIKIYGPGLDPINIVHPARYFTIELELQNKSKTRNVIKFKASGMALDLNSPCRLWSDILDRKDGSYFLRYRLYEPCKSFKLEITYDDRHVGGSPYHFGNDIVYNEQCNCPKWDLPTWIEKNRCGNIPEQIKQDLKLFPIINWDHIRSDVIKRFNKPEQISICHYLIFNNDLYRTCYGKHVGFNMFADNILLSLLRKMRIPDTEFFVNLGDWPLVRKDSNIVPVFSWCGSEDSYDIVMPTYDITGSTLENLGKVTLDMLSVQSNSQLPWKDRKSVAFWRGRDSNPTRLELIDMAHQYPELFNVSMTNFFFYRDKQDRYGPKTQHVSFYHFFHYKYQISIDGTVAAYRFPYLLAGGSLVFKQTSKYYEHFYHQLEPHKHYIPIESDLSDLISKLKWAQQNDPIAQQIAKQAQTLVNKMLLPKDIYCYHGHLLNSYSKLLQPVRLDNVLKSMEHVPQPVQSQNCGCKAASPSQNTKQEL